MSANFVCWIRLVYDLFVQNNWCGCVSLNDEVTVLLCVLEVESLHAFEALNRLLLLFSFVTVCYAKEHCACTNPLQNFLR